MTGSATTTAIRTRLRQDPGFLLLWGLVFAASVWATVRSVQSMAGAMPMPGQSPLSATAAFLVMWFAMMVAMMLPSLVPLLAPIRRHRDAGMVASGYFATWGLFGAVAYAAGRVVVAAAATSSIMAQLLPLASGYALLFAGVVQMTKWKARHLACCRAPLGALPGDAGSAWRYGVRLGVDCCLCCLGLMTVLLVTGVMQLVTMAVVAGVIAGERFGPWPNRIAKTVGVGIIGLGAVVVARSITG